MHSCLCVLSSAVFRHGDSCLTYGLLNPSLLFYMLLCCRILLEFCPSSVFSLTDRVSTSCDCHRRHPTAYLQWCADQTEQPSSRAMIQQVWCRSGTQAKRWEKKGSRRMTHRWKRLHSHTTAAWQCPLQREVGE